MRTLIVIFVLIFSSFHFVLFSQNDCSSLKCSKSKQSKPLLKTTETAQHIDVTYARCEWTIDPAELFIAGKITFYFKKLAESSLIEFDLKQDMAVDSITRNGNQVAFDHEFDVIKISESESFGLIDSLSIFYHGFPSQSGFGSFENEAIESGGFCLWTLSQPYGGKDWWPNKVSLTDKLDSLDIYVKTPSPNKVASNGVLVNTINDGEFSTFHWKSKSPIAFYLISLAVAPYQITENTVTISDLSQVKILQYGYENEVEENAFGLFKAGQYLRVMSEWTTPYPFKNEKYGHARCGFGGGMEHQTMSSMGYFGGMLIAHELAHQWFGDFITCGSWQDIWLNEGFATYFSALFEDFEYGTEAFYNWCRESNIEIISQPGGSLHVEDTTLVSRIFNYRLSYLKGAMVLHMLKKKMGEEPFFQMLKNYLNDENLQFGFSKTNDLKRHVEEVSQKNYDQFFYQWVYGEGYPIVNLDWYELDGELHFKFKQSTSHPYVNSYELDIPIKINGENGNVKDTIIQFNSNDLKLTFPIHFKVDSVRINQPNDLIGSYTSSQSFYNETLSNVSVFPNPSINEFQIKLDKNWNSDVKIELYAADGKLIDQKEVKTIETNIIKMIWPNYVSLSGLFYLKISNSNSVKIVKLIKTN